MEALSTAIARAAEQALAEVNQAREATQIAVMSTTGHREEALQAQESRQQAVFTQKRPAVIESATTEQAGEIVTRLLQNGSARVIEAVKGTIVAVQHRKKTGQPADPVGTFSTVWKGK